MPATLKAHDALHDAKTVAIVVHGVGDHASVDILRAAVSAPLSIWGDHASTDEQCLEGLPIPRDVDAFQFQRGLPVALEVLIDSNKHVVLPIIWSGIRRRAGRWADKGVGPNSLWLSLPILFTICFNLFRCVPCARGLWKIAVAFLAFVCGLLLTGVILGTFYLTNHLPFWLGTPFQMRWYTPVLAVGSLTIIAYVVKRIALLFDLVGDVAYYVSQKDKRRQIVQEMSTLIEFVAKCAPTAYIIVIGHSLGSVLVSQSLADLPSTYTGRGRTVLFTMGSPLVLLSRVFSAHVQKPDRLLEAYGSAELLLKWVNFWRNQDIIGRSLKAGSGERFVEISLGIGAHSDYWSDERLWASIAKILQDLPVTGSLEDLDKSWLMLPLSNGEESELVVLYRKLSLIRNLFWSVLVLTIQFQIIYLSPWERQFSIGVHTLIFVGWNLGYLPLGLAALMASSRFSWCKSRRDLLHTMRFVLGGARTLIILACVNLTIISSICLYSTRGRPVPTTSVVRAIVQ